MLDPDRPVAPSERIVALDVLRGLALLGMLLVHFHDHAADGTGWANAVGEAIDKLVSEKAYTTFSLLFGAGFAVQLARAEAKGLPFVPMYLRRLAALALFGLVAHAVLGFNVLIEYAAWGLPLLLVRRWPTRVLLALAILFSFSWPAYQMVRGAVEWRTIGVEASNAGFKEWQAEFSTAIDAQKEARKQATLQEAIPYRWAHVEFFYRQPWFWLPGQLSLFLFGLLAVRHGLFTKPSRHVRTIAWCMAVGLAMWGWGFVDMPVPGGPRRLAVGVAILPRSYLLAFTYIGAVLLLLAFVPRAARALAPFRWTGRMALTNYFAQIIAVDLLLDGYGLGLGEFPATVVLPGALLMYLLLLVASRWWLERYRYGPLEWMWRAATYGEVPQLARGAAFLP